MKKQQIQQISTLMKERGVSIPQLAKDCGISHMTIRRILKDEAYNPTIDTIKKIAISLGTNEHDIMDDDFEMINFKGVKGYIDYLGHISRIDSFKDLERCYMLIKADMNIPKIAKTILNEDKSVQKSLSKCVSNYCHIDLLQFEHYDATKVALWDFRKSDDERDEMPNNLGNMCKGYDFEMDGVHFLNSEAAYICGLFSENTKEHQDIQNELITELNGYATKKVIRRKYEYCGRKDWEEFNVQWMLYVVWCKCTSNRTFSDLLRHIPSHYTIVENSTHQKALKGVDTASFWGARNTELEEKRDILERYAEMQSQGRKAKDIAQAKMQARNNINHFGTWEGVNCMGKILTICKQCLENGIEPPIDYDLLRSKQIHLLGRKLGFTKRQD